MKKVENHTPLQELHGRCLFVSDAHFRTPQDAPSAQREEMLIQLIQKEGPLQHLFLLGDIFDFGLSIAMSCRRGMFVFLLSCKILMRKVFRFTTL